MKISIQIVVIDHIWIDIMDRWVYDVTSYQLQTCELNQNCVVTKIVITRNIALSFNQIHVIIVMNLVIYSPQTGTLHPYVENLNTTF